MTKNLIWPKIYILGDSLTQVSLVLMDYIERAFSVEGCWGSIVADEFQRKADFIARGFSGYNTRQCRALMPYIKNDLKDVSIAGVFLGANDANDVTINPQGVSRKEYKDNLINIISFMKESGIKSMFLITPPALDEDAWQTACLSNDVVCAKTSKMVAEYASTCAETAKEVGLPFVDLHTTMLQQTNWKEFLIDGLHFNANGSKFVASQILESLRTLWVKNDVIKGATEIMPSYNDISVTDPDASFREWTFDHL